MVTFTLSMVAFAALRLTQSAGSVRQEDLYLQRRHEMVEKQIAARGITNPLVKEAMLQVPRHLFVPPEYRKFAYDDRPLPIGYGQTISQPYIVAFMTEALRPEPTMKVLEIGTGSGYQAAILSTLVQSVYSIEIVAPLAHSSEKLFQKLGYPNIYVKTGDGYLGWPEHAPYDAIIVTCAPLHVPEALVEQLAEGGKMMIPVGSRNNQVLFLLEKKNGRIRKTAKLPVAFVPMVSN